MGRAGSPGGPTSFCRPLLSQDSSAAFSSNACKAAFDAGASSFFGDLDDLAEPAALHAARRAHMRRADWVVYAKPPFGGPAQVLAYLGRYTHRVAIANSRMVETAMTIMSASPGRTTATAAPSRPCV